MQNQSPSVSAHFQGTHEHLCFRPYELVVSKVDAKNTLSAGTLGVGVQNASRLFLECLKRGCGGDVAHVKTWCGGGTVWVDPILVIIRGD